ncbi:MAG: DUF126 domain-containing protein [Candidatus Odinarchaeum yellowstonii]|jgi:predicted aconitase with swiveling domain|uniref:Phosphomevalonate dehydratase small subunit n=1 Tax=Odinarchaeota yellowstonii (strain LCB_4) TaxID=1841599 RepID=A0AAF0D3J1_ODILC|nr:MAG: DUF126 domain-containing protein [Candidatus Odinarchaeum yellowstonii]
MILKGRSICKGRVEGKALVSKTPISFYGGVDAKTGRIIEKNHELFGEIIADKILFFPYGKGSTVGSYVLYQMAKNKVAPKGIVNIETEPIIAAGCILAGIPLVDGISENEMLSIKKGDKIRLDADNGVIEVL